MVTLNKPVKHKGICLISGNEAEIEIVPAQTGKGITFYNKDKTLSFKANIQTVLDTTHSTTIGTAEFHVKVVEHLMASLAFSKISDADIIVNGDEIPVCDGSAKIYCNLIKEAGIQTSRNTKKYSISKPLTFTHKHTSITAFPAATPTYTYVVNYPQTPFAYSWYKWQPEKDSPEEITGARTFGYVRDLPKMQAMGLAKGVSLDNTVGFNDDGTYTTELRYFNEPVRHKILDLIGDLYLTGISPYDLNINVIAIECGHGQHIQMSKLITDNIVEL